MNLKMNFMTLVAVLLIGIVVVWAMALVYGPIVLLDFAVAAFGCLAGYALAKIYNGDWF